MNKSLLKSLIFFIPLIGILSISSCKEPEEITIRNYWKLIQIEKRDVQPPIFIDAPEDLPIKVLFDQMGKVSIDSYCNSGSAEYYDKGASLEIALLTMTEIYCPNNEPIDWEAVFSYNFNLSEYYLIEEETLIILTAGDYNLHFTKI